MIAIIKYNAGNITSVQNALTRLGEDSIVTDDPDIILQADRVIFPGVGEASSAMSYLKERQLDTLITQIKNPFLGICLGLQLMCNATEESDTECLGIFDTSVKKFPPKMKVPHIGWNNLTTISGSLLRGITVKEDQYYAHSYYAEPCATTTGVCEYIIPFSAVMRKDNFYATQFHPEKSANVGNLILQNFIKL